MRLRNILLNNILINNILVWTGLEKKVRAPERVWEGFHYKEERSPQENAGFSHREDVDEALEKVREALEEVVSKYLRSGNRMLDLGCGPGLYLEPYEKEYRTSGLDISPEMVRVARSRVPEAHIRRGGLEVLSPEEQFHLVFSISVLEYIGPSLLKGFFQRAWDHLLPGGVLFLQYPHAVSPWDPWYPNRNYIKYSPRKVEHVCESTRFKILHHAHSFDGREVRSYDRKVYPGQNGSFRNGYLLIAQKPSDDP